MNCISRSTIALACALLPVACGEPASGDASPAASQQYRLDYRVSANPATATVDVELRVEQSRHLLREMRFSDDRVTNLEGDGSLLQAGGTSTWRPPPNGGTLRWSVYVPARRNHNGHDAWLGEDWGVFRAEDIIPRAATRTLVGAESVTTLSFELPGRWQAVTEYPEIDDHFRVARSGRRFMQPAGWIAIGQLGIRRDTISGIRVTVAAPRDQDFRRIDILALLNWTLPELARITTDLPDRLTIVGAADPMWRGGLSAPRSLYIHRDRPLISENGTSTLLHEVMHVVVGLQGRRGYDWIAEGLAEYYSLQLLARSGSLSAQRAQDAYDWQARWAADAERLCAESSSGPTTAYAVTIFEALDEELRDGTSGAHSLDDVVRRLSGLGRQVDLEDLRDAAGELLDADATSLEIDNLPGCRTLDDQ